MPQTRCLRLLVVGWCAALSIVAPLPAHAYLKFGIEVGGVTKVLRWSGSAPVPYYVSNEALPNVSAADFQAAISRAFNTWEVVPTATVSYRFAGFTSNRPGDDDGLSTLGFLNEPALDQVLATTSYLIDELTGELLESDVFFNSAYAWSAGVSAAANRWDVESIAVHEIGHFNGLGHSAIGETTVSPSGRRVTSVGSVMFPIAIGVGDITARTLDADDVAGLSDLYPTPQFTATAGSISGRVLKNGRGVFGAHVVAFDVATGAQVANFSLTTAGAFSITGLRPGPHLLRVEPLDDADLESFFGGNEPVDVEFAPRFSPKIIIVPRGGDSGTVTVAVTPR